MSSLNHITRPALRRGKKVNNITFDNLYYPQKYLSSFMFTSDQCSLLFNVRCQTVKDIKDNFHRMYGGDIQCELCNNGIDNQEHLLQCQALLSIVPTDSDITYNYILVTSMNSIRLLSCFLPCWRNVSGS